jgi:NTE family protein
LTSPGWVKETPLIEPLPSMPSEGETNRVDLVLEGGGVKGIGLVGALAVLEERGFRPQSLAGTSAGAIAAALTAAGYSAAELLGILAELDFNSFKDEGWEDRVPIVGTPLSILKDEGIYEGGRLLEWMRELLARRNIRTFGDLVDEEFAGNPRYRYKLQVIASDITARRLLVLPRDAERFGTVPDDLEIAEAVRMSMSIPIFFEPWRWVSKPDGEEHLIVDGGVLSNFPVWLFDSDGEPAWPTFGLLLVEPEPRRPVAVRLDATAGQSHADIFDFVKGLVQTVLEAHDRMYLENDSYVRTIGVPTLGVRTTEFDLSRERAEELYQSGRDAAVKFLQTWNFEDYKAAFREQEPPSRRELIDLALSETTERNPPAQG